MRVRFKGKDPRAGREIDLDPASAKRYISAGVAEEVKPPRTGSEAEPAHGETAERHHAAAKKATRSR